MKNNYVLKANEPIVQNITVFPIINVILSLYSFQRQVYEAGAVTFLPTPCSSRISCGDPRWSCGPWRLSLYYNQVTNLKIYLWFKANLIPPQFQISIPRHPKLANSVSVERTWQCESDASPSRRAQGGKPRGCDCRRVYLKRGVSLFPGGEKTLCLAEVSFANFCVDGTKSPKKGNYSEFGEKFWVWKMFLRGFHHWFFQFVFHQKLYSNEDCVTTRDP